MGPSLTQHQSLEKSLLELEQIVSSMESQSLVGLTDLDISILKEISCELSRLPALPKFSMLKKSSSRLRLPSKPVLTSGAIEDPPSYHISEPSMQTFQHIASIQELGSSVIKVKETLKIFRVFFKMSLRRIR